MTSSYSHVAPSIDLAASSDADARNQQDIHDEVLRLFDIAAPAIRRFVRACGVPHPHCDDVVQETFVALFRHLNRGGARHNLRGWLMQVSYRLALKHRQQLTRRLRIEAPWADEVDHAADPGESPDMELSSARDRRRLRRVFAALPDRQQQCLLLRAEGMTYREIAKVLRISLGMVAKSLALAVTRLSNAVNF